MTERGIPVYDRITVSLHWLTAALVVILWLIGEFVEDLLAKGPLRSAIWSLHFVLGFVFTAVILALLVWRQTKGRQLPVEDPWRRLHHLAKATHAALYILIFIIVGLGTANAFVRGVHLFGPIDLPQLGDKALRRPLTHWHGLAANLPDGRDPNRHDPALVHHSL